MSSENSNDSWIEKFLVAVIIGALLMYAGTKLKFKFQELATTDMTSVETR